MKGPTARPILLVLLMLVVAPVSATSQTVFYVHKQNPTPGDGLSWASAFKHPKDALAAADTVAGPVEIWVTTATYLAASGVGDPAVSFELRSDLEFLGGFVGTESDKNQRDPIAHPTILSGDIGLNNIVADDTYHVVRADSLSGPVLMDGFQIIHGNASQTGGDGLGGGGLLIRDSDVTLRQCVLVLNWAGGPFPQFGDNGAAVHIDGSGTLTVENCSFSDNEAYFGAGIDVGNVTGNVDVSIFNSTFERNRALEGGGAGLSFSEGSLTIERTSFLANRARLAVALQVTLAQQVILRDCDFGDNRGQQRAAVLLDRSDNGGLTPAIIERSRFFDNTATTAVGSALHTDGTAVEVSDCEFRRNRTLRVSPVNGDFQGTGTVALIGRGGNRFTNSIFADNFAGTTAGLLLRSAPTTVLNTTFANNHSASADSIGAGVATSVDGDLSLRNVILWGNRISTGENDDQVGTGGQIAQFSLAPNSTITLGFSDIEGWMGGAADQTFGADPLFVNETFEDYHLLGSSPGIDTGDNSAIDGLATLDLDGQPRIMDGLFDGGMRVDLGPYEFVGNVVAVEPDAALSALGLRARTENGLVRIDYALPHSALLRMDVFDLRGRKVKELLATQQTSGDHFTVWDRRDGTGHSIASGVYFIRLEANGTVATAKVALVP